MRVDRQVAQKKFENEILHLKLQSEVLQKRGIIVTKIEYPSVEIILIPVNTLKIIFPVRRIDLKLGSLGVENLQLNMFPPNGTVRIDHIVHPFTTITASTFGVRILLDDFDQQAPSVTFCDALTWEDLSAESMINRGRLIGTDGKTYNVIPGAHPKGKKPFLCIPGIREYHEHPQHTGDDWMRYRRYCGLFSTIDAVWRACIAKVAPIIVVPSPDKAWLQFDLPGIN